MTAEPGYKAVVGRVFAKLRLLPVTIGYFRGPPVMSGLRKRWVLFRNPHADIRFGPGTYVGPGFSLHAPLGGTFTTGAGVEFKRGFRAELGSPGARITIGANTACTYDVLIQCTTSVDIGSDCGLGQNTLIVDGNHRYRNLDEAPLRQGWDFRPIRIDDGAVAWSKNTIVANLGERAVLASGAIATRAIPAYTLAVGAPAQPVEYFGPPGLGPEGLPKGARLGT